MEAGKVLPWVVRLIGAPLFFFGGCCLVLISLIGVPSYWYFLCFCALPVIGAFWAWRPRIGAALASGPLIAVIAWLRFLSGAELASAVICLIVALLCTFFGMRGTGRIRALVGVSLSFLCGAFAVDRLFTNQVTIRTYQVQVAMDGRVPWGTVYPEWSGGPPPIVLYRKAGDSYCYIAFRSQELGDHLRSRDDSVSMQVNVFRDFGRERGYNVRSVDGLLLANGQHSHRDAERFGGQVLGGSGEPPPECW